MNALPSNPFLFVAEAAFARLAQRLAGRRRGVPCAADAASALVLTHRALHRVPRPLGRRITCDAGALWLTFDGIGQDIVLMSGQAHDCRDASSLVIYALADARVHVGARPARLSR